MGMEDGEGCNILASRHFVTGSFGVEHSGDSPFCAGEQVKLLDRLGVAFPPLGILQQGSFGVCKFGESPFLHSPFLSYYSSGVEHFGDSPFCPWCRLACPKIPNRGNRECPILVPCFIWGGTFSQIGYLCGGASEAT